MFSVHALSVSPCFIETHPSVFEKTLEDLDYALRVLRMNWSRLGSEDR